MGACSDGTLNPGGVRFGSAEIYNVMANVREVADSLAVGQKRGSDERVVLFVKMADGQTFTKALEDEIRKLIRTLLSPRHVPEIILPIEDIPVQHAALSARSLRSTQLTHRTGPVCTRWWQYTINGKKVEVAVKKIISGEHVVASGTLANPAVLDLYRNLPQLSL